MQHGTAHVEVREVGHSYGRHGPPVLEGVSFSIARGQAVALVGRSGCGKSTLLHFIAGLSQPRSGWVAIGGEKLARPSPRWNMMFQTPSLFPWMSVAENVALGLRYGGAAREVIRARVAELLALVKLEDFAKTNVQTLSGGQQQRVALARSLATSPEILLLDEPFSALDPFTRRALQDEVRAIAARLGLTLVIVTHDVDEALLMSDRVLVMAPAPGRIVADVAVPPTRDRDSLAFAQARAAVLTPFEDTLPQSPPRNRKTGWRFPLLALLPAFGRDPR